MTHEPRIYFVKSTRSNAVKIGTSADVAQRMLALRQQSFSRLVLIAEIPGDERYEKILHEHFAECRIKGEWFRCVGRLAEFLTLLPSLPTVTRTPSRRRLKQQQPQPQLNRDAVCASWRKQLALIDRAVRSYGVARFAHLVGSKRYIVEDALQERNNRRWPGEWMERLAKITSRESMHAILDAGMELSPFRLDFDTWSVVPDPVRGEVARRLVNS
jgi:hypothetical protein